LGQSSLNFLLLISCQGERDEREKAEQLKELARLETLSIRDEEWETGSGVSSCSSKTPELGLDPWEKYKPESLPEYKPRPYTKSLPSYHYFTFP